MEKVTYTTPLVPRQVRLEFGSFCNAKCLTCHGFSPLHPMTRAKGHMSRELLEKYLEEIRTWPQQPAELVPSNYSETMASHPNWYEFLEMMARKLPRVPIVFPSNGVLLSDGRLELLCRIRTLALVNFSVNAYTPELWEAFHGLPARHLETVKAAVVRLRQLRPDVTIWISMVRDPSLQSPKEEELFRQYWGQYGTVQINVASYAGWPGKEPPIPVKLPCRSIFSDLVVLWDGRISSCCFDADGDIIFADATKTALLDCWHSAEFNRLRQLHNGGKRDEVALCRSCTFA